MENKKVCECKFDEDENSYDTSCGDCIIINSGSRKENNFHFCPVCGGKIKEI